MKERLNLLVRKRVIPLTPVHQLDDRAFAWRLEAPNMKVQYISDIRPGAKIGLICNLAL